MPARGIGIFPYPRLRRLGETDLFVVAVIDGPFQSLSEKAGLMKVLTGWVRERKEVLKACEKERENIEKLLDDCLERSVHGVVIADDLAGDKATFLDPLHIERFFSVLPTRRIENSSGPCRRPFSFLRQPH